MPVPPEQRPTAKQLRDGDKTPVVIAGKPADECPYCGATMFVYGTRTAFTQGERRYVECRNCKKAFESQQPPAVIVREVNRHKDSRTGNAQLTVHRESA